MNHPAPAGVYASPTVNGYANQPPSKTMRPQVGQLINNKYRLVRQIGDGGMGSVFEATHEALGSRVALKFLHSELARRSGLVQRFLQEARVSAKIDSPNVCRVSDVEQTPEGLPFIVMEFLQGKSLQSLYEELYRAGQRLPYEQALQYATQMLDGLEAAHEASIVHRDLKPDNVMIVRGKKGEQIVKLLDFGIAKLRINGELHKGLTRPGVIMGTPEYMAPEQVFSADAVDARADIFSCGVMIFEMLAGRRPVGGDEPHQIAAQYLAGTIAKLSDLAPQLPAELAAAVHKAMASDPKNRFDTTEEFRSALVAAAGTVRPASTPHHVTPAGSDPRVSNVPKTIPPADEPGAVAVSPVLASPAGISWEDEPADGGATEKVAEPWHGGGTNGAPTSDKGATVEATPFFPGSTEAYQPVDEKAPAPVAPARPGGTAVGDAARPASSATVAPKHEAKPRAASALPAQHVSPARAPARKKKGLGIVGIVMIGLAASGALMGGLFAYDQLGRSEVSDDDQKTMPLPTHKKVVEGEPPKQPPQTDPQPVATWQTPPVTPTTPPAKTQPTTTNTTTKPGPTTTTTTTKPAPTTPPPWMIPSTLPPPPVIPGWPPFPGTQPAQPAPGTTTSPGRPKLEPILPGGSTVTPPPPATTQPPAPPPPKRAEPRIPRIPRGTTASAKPTTTAKPETSTTPPTQKRPIKLRPLGK